MKTPKKSESLEVRLSFEDKQALQAKASKEGRTVSDVIRGLISDYVKPNKARAALNPLTELFMTLTSKPKTFAAMIMALFIVPFVIAPFANAEEIEINLKGEYVTPVIENGKEGTRTRRFETDVLLENGKDFIIPLNSTSPSLSLSISDTQIGDDIKINLTFMENDKVIAEPWLTTHYDTPARFEVGHKGGEIFTLTALPKAPSQPEN